MTSRPVAAGPLLPAIDISGTDALLIFSRLNLSQHVMFLALESRQSS